MLQTLSVGPGCVLTLSGPLPAVVFTNDSVIQDDCDTFAQVVAQLPPKQRGDSTTVIVFVTQQVSVISPWNNPLGDQRVWGNVTGYGFQLTSVSVGKLLQKAAGVSEVCVGSDIGDWGRFFESPNFIALAVLLSLLYISFGLAACVRLVFAIHRRQTMPIIILVTAISMALCKNPKIC